MVHLKVGLAAKVIPCRLIERISPRLWLFQAARKKPDSNKLSARRICMKSPPPEVLEERERSFVNDAIITEKLRTKWKVSSCSKWHPPLRQNLSIFSYTFQVVLRSERRDVINAIPYGRVATLKSLMCHTAPLFDSILFVRFSLPRSAKGSWCSAIVTFSEEVPNLGHSLSST